MKRSGFTMIELLVAILIYGIMTTFAILTYNAVSNTWEVSTDYMDKMQRTDYALNQVESALKSAYYPHNDQQDERYGFVLKNNGDGQDPNRSDIVEWAKTGSSLVGGADATADTVHRVQIMVLEEGNTDYKNPIEVTGLYARMCSDPALRPNKETDSSGDDYSFENKDLYQPVLVVDGVVGLNCRIMEEPNKKSNAKNNENLFADEWTKTNSLPYKVELTFWMRDKEAKSYRTNVAPLMRIVRLPMYEQSQDGAKLPSDEDSGKGKSGSKKETRK